MEKEPKDYEIGFLLKDEKDSEEVSEILNRHQATLIKPEERLPKIRLAYPIKKENFAFFGYFHFSANPNRLKELEEELKLNKKLMRFIIISQPATGVPRQPFIKPRRRIVPMAPTKTIEPVQPIKKVEPAPILSNEELEKKLEEILK